VLFVEPDNLKTDVNDGSVTLGMRWRKKIGHQSVEFASKEVFRIELPEAVSLDRLSRDWVKPLRYLLALATGVLPRIRTLEVGKVQTLEGGTIEFPATVVSAFDRGQEGEPPRITQHQMLLTLNDIQYEADIPKWFNIVRKHEAACDLIFSRGLSSRTNLTSRFFDVASAAEASDLAMTRLDWSES
jgi:hypothetical protein